MSVYDPADDYRRLRLLADEYLRIHLPHASEKQMIKVKAYVYRRIESGENYLKACHEALLHILPALKDGDS